jgi:hypothetical protein
VAYDSTKLDSTVQYTVPGNVSLIVCAHRNKHLVDYFLQFSYFLFVILLTAVMLNVYV